uniref:Si:ch211-120k19.1 n=1 Tax=Echeneis naucrates TaxID=173247 RepID=A0A665VD06_ECHNA
QISFWPLNSWAVFKAHPYISNVLGYTALFSSADVIQQSVLGGKPDIDWCQTARVATVGFCFHANFNYHWLRWLERMLPGGGVKAVTGKVVVDQLVAAPLTISAFYIGLSLLENKDDPLEDWRQKFWTSYKSGVIYWSTMQVRNPSIIIIIYFKATHCTALTFTKSVSHFILFILDIICNK